MRVVHSLKPIYDRDSQILILGSIPSKKSRELGFYYGHKQNRFWKVLEIVFEEPIFDREQFCHEHHLALYDVIESCEIEGSSDHTIRDVVPSDLSRILNESQIHTIITTGKKAYELYQRYQFPKTNMEAIALPSTSPANAAYRLDQLVNQYQIIKKSLR